MNKYLVFILIILLARYLVDLAAEWLNVRNMSMHVPDEFKGLYDDDRYRKSQEYLRDNTRVGIIRDTFHTGIIMVFIVAGGFDLVDRFVRGFGLSSIESGLMFTGILALSVKIIDLPFSVYDTFFIEEKYGFNRTTSGVFVMDFFKLILMTAVIGAPVLAVVIWFFEEAGGLAWLYCWVAVALIQICLMFVAPAMIMPLFNRFEPLEEGELKKAIEDCARSQDFEIKGIYTMDGSKRTARSNAFFTGFGRFRRIVLFDTLLEKHTVQELVSIIGHEIGHYTKKHILKGVLRYMLTSGAAFYLLSLFIGNQALFLAFKMQNVSVYAGLVFFGFLFEPFAVATGVIENYISRRQEHEADKFAVEACGSPEALISGLKKLSVDNLSNLTPHSFTVFMRHSHPPIQERIAAIRAMD